MKEFEAHECKINERGITFTGKVATYLAQTIEDAVQKVLYTARLADGKARVGPTGRCVHAAQGSWSVVPAK